MKKKPQKVKLGIFLQLCCKNEKKKLFFYFGYFCCPPPIKKLPPFPNPPPLHSVPACLSAPFLEGEGRGDKEGSCFARGTLKEIYFLSLL